MTLDEPLAGMTLDEKVGQMTKPDQEFLDGADHVREHMVGSLLSDGGPDPATSRLDDWRAMYEMYQAKAAQTRLGIPLLYGVEAVHGHAAPAQDRRMTCLGVRSTLNKPQCFSAPSGSSGSPFHGSSKASKKNTVVWVAPAHSRSSS